MRWSRSSWIFKASPARGHAKIQWFMLCEIWVEKCNKEFLRSSYTSSTNTSCKIHLIFLNLSSFSRTNDKWLNWEDSYVSHINKYSHPGSTSQGENFKIFDNFHNYWMWNLTNYVNCNYCHMIMFFTILRYVVDVNLMCHIKRWFSGRNVTLTCCTAIQKGTLKKFSLSFHHFL